MRFPIASLFVVLAFTSPAAAEPYWVAYEGNDFPENEGWVRNMGGGGAERSLPGGLLVLDSRHDHAIFDFYEVQRAINPDAGELFVAEWRVRIDDNLNWRDTGIVIAPDTYGTLALEYEIDHLVSAREGWSVPIVPCEFHTYRVESWDMENYSLWIDGQFARYGTWDLDGVNQSFVNFGDGNQFGGTGSLAEWDYFRFGVVPEPASLALLVGLVVCCWWEKRDGKAGTVGALRSERFPTHLGRHGGRPLRCS